MTATTEFRVLLHEEPNRGGLLFTIGFSQENGGVVLKKLQCFRLFQTRDSNQNLAVYNDKGANELIQQELESYFGAEFAAGVLEGIKTLSALFGMYPPYCLCQDWPNLVAHDCHQHNDVAAHFVGGVEVPCNCF
jgi:hypothetical protein